MLRNLAYAAALASAALAANALAQNQVSGIKPLSPAPAAEALKPGLTPLYYFNLYNHISEVPTGGGFAPGRPGAPILELNHRGADKPVFETGYVEGVGAYMTGLIHLAKPGEYTFVAKSNDGIQVAIDGKVVTEDPDVHADRFSMPGTVKVTQAGWYPLAVKWFQKKNTWAIELHWQPPGEEQMSIVPAAAYAHIPK